LTIDFEVIPAGHADLLGSHAMKLCSVDQLIDAIACGGDEDAALDYARDFAMMEDQYY
jgi:hypothetical protein